MVPVRKYFQTIKLTASSNKEIDEISGLYKKVPEIPNKKYFL